MTTQDYGFGVAPVMNPLQISQSVNNPTAGIWYVNANAEGPGSGSINNPFKTITAAIAVASDFDTIFVTTKGDHPENVVMRDLNGIAIVGNSESNTSIINVGNAHTFSWIPGATTGAAVTKFSMSHIELINTDTTGTYRSLHVDADAVQYPNVFCGAEFDMTTVDCEGAQTVGNATVYFRNVGKAYWTHGDVSGGDLTITNCSEFITRQVQVGTLVAPMNLNAEYNGNNHYNGLGRSNVTLAQQSVVYGDLNALGHPILQVDSSTLVVGSLTGTLTSFYASGRDYCPLIIFYGALGLLGGSGGNATLTFPDPQTSGSAFSYLDLSGAHILGNLSLTKTNFLPATSRGYAVIAGTADFHSGTITTSGYVNLELTGSNYSHSLLTVGAGSIVTRNSKEAVTITASRAARTDDSGIVIRCDHATVAINVTVNADAAVGWSKSEELTIYQAGAAAANFAAGSGVTFRGTNTAAQYKTTRLMRVGANEWAYA